MPVSDQSNERLHQQASAQYLQGKFDEALATWRQILTDDPEDERASEGVRLCELLTEDGEPAATAATSDEPPSEVAEINIAAPEDLIEFEVPDLEIDLPEKPSVDAECAEAELNPIVDGILGDDTAPGIEDATAAQLKKRVQDLIGEAQAAYDGGDTESARTVLARVFILDESNADALQLQEQIKNEIAATTEQIEVADLDAPENPAPTKAEPTLDDAATDSFPEFDVDAEFEEEEEQDEISEVESEAVAPAPSKIRLPQLDLASMKTRWIVIGVGLGIFVMVGVGLWMKLRTLETPDVAPPIMASVEAIPAPEPNTDLVVEAPVAQVEPEPAPQLNLAPPEDLATLFERGNKAFAAGEYSTAIVAFNAVLKQQPNHFEANDQMQLATEGYRRQQETQQQWIAATSLFRDGEYRSAMQMFYRLPENSYEDRVRLERYTENGWYNMGLLALRSGQCALARGHLEEAAQVDPEDADIAMALALCDTCEGGTRRNGFQRAVAAMSIRGLDD